MQRLKKLKSKKKGGKKGKGNGDIWQIVTVGVGGWVVRRVRGGSGRVATGHDAV